MCRYAISLLVQSTVVPVLERSRSGSYELPASSRCHQLWPILSRTQCRTSRLQRCQPHPVCHLLRGRTSLAGQTVRGRVELIATPARQHSDSRERAAGSAMPPLPVSISSLCLLAVLQRGEWRQPTQRPPSRMRSGPSPELSAERAMQSADCYCCCSIAIYDVASAAICCILLLDSCCSSLQVSSPFSHSEGGVC